MYVYKQGKLKIALKLKSKKYLIYIKIAQKQTNIFILNRNAVQVKKNYSNFIFP